MSELADEIACLKILLEESRAAIKALRVEVAELKLTLHFQGLVVAPLANDSFSEFQKMVKAVSG